MATLFRNSSVRLSVITDAFSRLQLQPAGVFIVPRQPSHLRFLTQTAVLDRDSRPHNDSDDTTIPRSITQLPLPPHSYGTKMRPRLTAPKLRPSLQWTVEDDKELFRLAKEGKTSYEIYANHFPNRSHRAIVIRMCHAKRLAKFLEREAREGVVVREGEGEVDKPVAAAAEGGGGGEEGGVGEEALSFRSKYYKFNATMKAERQENDKGDDSVFRPRDYAKDIRRKGKWTEAEDGLLEQLVHRHIQIPEPALWSIVAGGRVGDSLLLRDALSCCRRWRVLFPPPSVRTGPWTDEEERLLQGAIWDEFEGKYQVAVDVLVGKPATTTLNRSAWRSELKQLPGQDGLPILKLGSRRLRMLSWLTIAEKVGSRSERDCRAHFYQVYHNANRGALTPDEKARLMEGLKMYGKDYWKIAEHVGTRSPIQVTKIVSRLKQEKRTDRTAGSSSDKE
ncbi:hypothetical protein BGW39_009423 [Mortierella sp. 14UC]|nr:hypothetical protein BGW39_009423 [Mortierella sp. 14UC]